MAIHLTDDVLSWATDLDERTEQQARTTASMPFVRSPLALMADAHLGLGATVGSVIATEGAIIPAAVGVDIGCGMAAVDTGVRAEQLPDDLAPLHHSIGRAVPAGVPSRRRSRQGSHSSTRAADLPAGLAERAPEQARTKADKVRSQFGTLGSGNHFVELCLDEQDRVWVVLHSGSRGIGNEIARRHIERAKGLMARYFIDLPDPDLAYLVEQTPEFGEYIDAMTWAQDYALGNRDAMLTAILDQLRHHGLPVEPGDRVQCHHNYTQREHHHGRDVWVTRKGAIRARVGDRGVIPGSMATGSFIVEGLGSPASYTSASHGAGRRLSRRAAKQELTPDSLVERMDGITWNDDARGLLDEHPEAYKDLGEVMANQQDLVRPVHRLRCVLNYKGT
ncbi:MAG: RtcB family protein [Actinomycetota bacterium]